MTPIKRDSFDSINVPVEIDLNVYSNKCRNKCFTVHRQPPMDKNEKEWAERLSMEEKIEREKEMKLRKQLQEDLKIEYGITARLQNKCWELGEDKSVIHV